MTTRTGRYMVLKLLERGWNSHERIIQGTSRPRADLTRGSIQRCFSAKKHERQKVGRVETENDSENDEDWEDDQEIPFGEPMRPRSKHGKASLQAVIDSGLKSLQATSSLIANQKETQKPLFHKGALTEDTGPTKQQLAEANRVLSVANRCLEALEEKKKAHPLMIQGCPIMILHVEVNANLREATLYWALPFEILYHANQEERAALTDRMQHRIEREGGGGFLQRQVHGILSSYYPPKFKFKPAPEALLFDMMSD